MRRVHVIGAVLLALSGAAQGATLDTDPVGLRLATAGIAATPLVDGPNVATAFGTMPTWTADPGLAAPLAGANIVITPDETKCVAGSCDAPDDVGVRSASNLEIALTTPVYFFGSDPIDDVENAAQQNGSMLTHKAVTGVLPSGQFRDIEDSLEFDLN
jgi:hypothetical protein